MWSRRDERKLRTSMSHLKEESVPESLQSRLSEMVGAEQPRVQATVPVSRRRPRRVVAVATLLIVISAVGAVLWPRERGDLLTQVVAAMEEIKTGHAIGRLHGDDFEWWIVRDYGFRNEGPNHIQVVAVDQIWFYDKASGELSTGPGAPDRVRQEWLDCIGMNMLEYAREEGILKSWEEATATLDGEQVTRVDAVITPPSRHLNLSFWLDPHSNHVLKVELSEETDEGLIEVSCLESEWDVSIDLDIFEPPAH